MKLNKTGRERLAMIEADCKTDTLEAEGQPFTGKVISEQLGLIRAMISAVATTIIEAEEKE